MRQNDEPIVFNESSALDAVNKYGTGIFLWDKFWSFLRAESEAGATYSYIEQCAETLEKIWLLEIGERKKMNFDINDLRQKKPVVKNIRIICDVQLDNEAQLELIGVEFDGKNLKYGEDGWLHESGYHDQIWAAVREAQAFLGEQE